MSPSLRTSTFRELPHNEQNVFLVFWGYDYHSEGSSQSRDARLREREGRQTRLPRRHVGGSLDPGIAPLSQCMNCVTLIQVRSLLADGCQKQSHGRRDPCVLSPDSPALSPARLQHRPTQIPRSLTPLCLHSRAFAVIRGRITNKSGGTPPTTNTAHCLVLPVSAPLTTVPRRLDTSSLSLAAKAKPVAVLG
jgi:hypothetical protein